MANEHSMSERKYGGRIVAQDDRAVVVRLSESFRFRHEGRVYEVRDIPLERKTMAPYLLNGNVEVTDLPYEVVLPGFRRSLRRQHKLYAEQQRKSGGTGNPVIDQIFDEWAREERDDEVDAEVPKPRVVEMPPAKSPEEEKK